MSTAAAAQPDAFSAAAGSVIHLLPGWALGLPVAVVVGPRHEPFYIYRDGGREAVEQEAKVARRH